MVVCATGYHVSFRFLPPGLVPVTGRTAQVYGGCVLAEYKNLYIIGTSQLRYGFGRVVTPGVDLIARMMLAQDQMELPLGLVMKESGVKLPITHLVDPHAALRGIRRGKRMLPVLLWREKRARKKLPGRAAPPPILPPPPSSIDLRILGPPAIRTNGARPWPRKRANGHRNTRPTRNAPCPAGHEA